ncbi:MAG: starch-binding protein [Muribaculaceae bacterium]|nr:starch-binding protein [Muribaculaceae bacterium]
MKKFHLSLASLVIAISAMAQGWPANYGGIMLQGFYWDSYDYTKWENLTNRSEELGSIFDLIWVPNSAMTRGGNKAETMGYMPYSWLRHTTIFGTQSKLTNMIQTYGAMGTGIIEDLILNHKDGKAKVVAPGDTLYLEFLDETVGDYSVTWDNENFTGIVCNDDQPGGGNYDTGDGFDGARDLDHTNSRVQQNCITYQNFLLNEIGYVGFRLDMTKGYAAQYTGKYNAATNPIFSVGEYFDGNTDLLKQWINGTTVNGAIQSGTFDFALKFAINEAFGYSNWGALDLAGLIADDNYKRYAVTFVDNHDTYEDHNKLGNNIEAANAFILAMPGTPCIFSKHYEDYKTAITNMIKGRRSCGITNQSSCTSTSMSGGIIFTTTGSKGKVMIRLGAAANSTPSASEYQLVQSGTNYAFYITSGIDWENSEKTGKIIGFPVIDKPSGVYANSVTVKIKSSLASTTLVYTTDGTTPTPESQQITSPTTLTFTENTVLKVGALMDGEVSDIATRNYIIADADPNSITIFVKSTNAPYLYVWEDDGTIVSDTWPGTELTSKRTVGGQEFYYRTYTKPSPDYKFNFILSEGDDTTQTQEVNNVAGDVFYTFSGQNARDLSNIYLAELYNPFVCIDKPSGDLPANKKVYINASYGDAKIVFTTDGSVPTAASQQATAMKELSFTTVGEQVTVKAGLLINDQVKGIVTRNYKVVNATSEGGGSTSNTVKIYCKATNAPYLYSWEDGGTQHNGDWPGTLMTESETIDGVKWWTYTYDVKPINIIFNDGNGSQTGNIEGLLSDSYFEYNGTTTATNVTSQYVDLTSADIPSCATWIDGLQFVYFESNNYYEPYTWVWNTSTNFTGSVWPGVGLIDVVGVAPSGKNIYRWTTSNQAEPTGIIFSNYGWPQTSDFIFVNGGYYTESGLLGVLEAKPVVYGDVNGDGTVTASDITEIYNYLLDGDQTYITTCDVNGDGEITSYDITAVYDILLGNK